VPPSAAVPSPASNSTSLALQPSPWLVAFLVAGLLLPVLLRPLRRLVTLRHLQAPLWKEPLDQRVSNLWQLVLVGLRDAGWHAGEAESPGALARRVDLPGAETCAVVLERVRHGVRLEPGDFDAMHEAALSTYRAARGGLGPVARMLSWVRWPLV
jgi:hypothetical protein